MAEQGPRAIGAARSAGGHVPAPLLPNTPDSPATPLARDDTTTRTLAPQVADLPARVYVPNERSGSVSVIDLAQRRVVQSWTVGGSPDMLTLSADGRQLWTGNRFGSSVIVIDSTSGQVIRTIPVESAPHGLTYFPQPGRVSIGHNGVYR